MSALDIQREYLSSALRYAEERGFPEEEQRALLMWEHCVSTIENDPMKLERLVDWVTKLSLIDAYKTKNALSMNDAKLQLIDLQYHDIRRDRGLFYRLARHEQVESVVAETDILNAMSVPPQTTRARLRGAFISAAKAKKRDYTVDWVHLKLNDQAQRTVLCKDPFKSRDERVERLIESL
jgi:proteasome accessory factor A